MGYIKSGTVVSLPWWGVNAIRHTNACPCISEGGTLMCSTDAGYRTYPHISGLSVPFPGVVFQAW